MMIYRLVKRKPSLTSVRFPANCFLLFENRILFDEKVDDRLLVAVKPAGQRDYEEVEGLYDGGHCPNRLSTG